MNDMDSIDRHFAPSGLGMFSGVAPRALPWAIALGPFGAAVGGPGYGE